MIIEVLLKENFKNKKIIKTSGYITLVELLKLLSNKHHLLIKIYNQ